MEPHNLHNPPMGELPQPEQPQVDPSLPSVEQTAATPEIVGSQQPAASQSNPLPTIDPSLLANASVPPAGSPTPAAHLQATTPIADDSDLIEKEWVLRAKAIVMHTKNDPHQQSDEMNKVKADYMKKRYNKNLKLNED